MYTCARVLEGRREQEDEQEFTKRRIARTNVNGKRPRNVMRT